MIGDQCQTRRVLNMNLNFDMCIALSGMPGAVVMPRVRLGYVHLCDVATVMVSGEVLWFVAVTSQSAVPALLTLHKPTFISLALRILPPTATTYQSPTIVRYSDP
jgi:hypothetical protein